MPLNRVLFGWRVYLLVWRSKGRDLAARENPRESSGEPGESRENPGRIPDSPGACRQTAGRAAFLASTREAKGILLTIRRASEILISLAGLIDPVEKFTPYMARAA